MEPQIRVLIIDDRRLFIESVAVLLGNRREINLIGSIGNPRGLPDRLKALSLDIALISATIEVASIMHLIRAIKRMNPSLKIIIYGLDCSDESIIEFIEAGVSGYLLKEASFRDLLQTIHEAHQGRTSCSPSLAAKVFARITELSRHPAAQPRLRENLLTPREREIVELIVSGLGNKDIAHHLNISLFTVKNHVHNILEKFQVKYRREAIRCAYESGLLIYPRPYSAPAAKHASQV